MENPIVTSGTRSLITLILCYILMVIEPTIEREMIKKNLRNQEKLRQIPTRKVRIGQIQRRNTITAAVCTHHHLTHFRHFGMQRWQNDKVNWLTPSPPKVTAEEASLHDCKGALASFLFFYKENFCVSLLRPFSPLISIINSLTKEARNGV